MKLLFVVDGEAVEVEAGPKEWICAVAHRALRLVGYEITMSNRDAWEIRTLAGTQLPTDRIEATTFRDGDRLFLSKRAGWNS